jgi:CubicO group peptidase (beta-lactamase class C family)
VAAGTLLSFGNLPAQPGLARVDSLMQGYHQSGKFTGAVLVAQNGSIVYNRGFGKADLAANTPNEPGTVFFIASLTKPFTAVLIMQLAEAGKLQMEHTLGRYFPGLKNEAVRQVTIHQLLSHTSGIPDFIGPSLVTEKGLTDAWLTGQLDQLTPDPAPGKEFRYANSTYIVLARILEKIYRKPYARLLKENILDKCGMTRSGSMVTGEKVKNSAKGYVMAESTLTEAAPMDLSVFKGAGSVYSTADDLFKFDQALYTQKLISDHSKELMFSTTGNYGYGWFIRQIPGTGKAVYHEGGVPGYTSLLFRAVEKKYCIILLSNNESDDPHKGQITRSIVGVLNTD